MLPLHLPAAALLPGFVPAHVDGFLPRQQQEHLLEVIAVLQARKATVGNPVIKAVERAESHVLLIDDARRTGSHALADQFDQLSEIAFPELSKCLAITGLDLSEPDADGSWIVQGGLLRGRSRGR